MINDPVADLLTRIRNSQRAGHKSVRIRKSKMAERILSVLKDEGFVGYFDLKKDAQNKFEEFEVGLKYYGSGDPCIRSIKRVSTPGQRRYAAVDYLPRVDCGLGISIVSTSEGVMSDREARRRKVGGELLAKVS